MANHVIHTFTVKGDAEEINRFKKSTMTLTENNQIIFDFNSIIPMPKELDIDDSSDGKQAHSLLRAEPESLLKNTSYLGERALTSIKDIFMFDEQIWNILTIGEFLKIHDFLVDYPDSPKINFINIPLGKQYQINIELHGHPTWYDWSCENWGSKWNSWSFTLLVDENEENQQNLCFQFTTAWSPVIPIFDKLADLFPKLIFSVAYIDEFENFAGLFTSTYGEKYLQDLDQEDPRMRDFLTEHFGYNFSDEDEVASDTNSNQS